MSCSWRISSGRHQHVSPLIRSGRLSATSVLQIVQRSQTTPVSCSTDNRRITFFLSGPPCRPHHQSHTAHHSPVQGTPQHNKHCRASQQSAHVPFSQTGSAGAVADTSAVVMAGERPESVAAAAAAAAAAEAQHAKQELAQDAIVWATQHGLVRSPLTFPTNPRTEPPQCSSHTESQVCSA